MSILTFGVQFPCHGVKTNESMNSAYHGLYDVTGWDPTWSNYFSQGIPIIVPSGYTVKSLSFTVTLRNYLTTSGSAYGVKDTFAAKILSTKYETKSSDATGTSVHSTMVNDTSYYGLATNINVPYTSAQEVIDSSQFNFTNLSLTEGTYYLYFYNTASKSALYHLTSFNLINENYSGSEGTNPSGYYDLTADPNGGYIYVGGPDADPWNETTYNPIVYKFKYGSMRHVANLALDYNDKYESDYCWFVDSLNRAAPIRPGYYLKEWKVTSGGGTVNEYAAGTYADTLTPDSTSSTDLSNHAPTTSSCFIYSSDYEGDSTVVAQWEPNTYIINYVVNAPEGTVTMASNKLLYTTDNFYFPTPDPIEGYTFLGWNTSSDLNGYLFDANQIVNIYTFIIQTGITYRVHGSETTLYGVWSENQYYTLTIDPDGGNMFPGGPEHASEIYPDSVTSVTEKYTKTFLYGTKRYLTDLYNNPSISDGVGWIVPFSSYPVSGSSSKYGYQNIGWQIVSGGGSVNEYIVGDVRAMTLLPTAASDTDFVERYTEGDYNSFVFDGNYAGDVEIKPIWKGNQYQFTYDINLPNDLTEEEISLITQPDAINTDYTSTFSSPILPNLNDWTFLGWNIATDATVALPLEMKMSSFILAYDMAVRPSINMGMQTDVTIPLYAVWVKKGLVNLYLDGEWKTAQVYIYTNDTDKWKRTIPYLYTSEWKQVTGG